MEPSSWCPLVALIDLTVNSEAAVIPTIASAMRMWAFLTFLANPIADAIHLVHQVSCSELHRSGCLRLALLSGLSMTTAIFAVSGKALLPPHSSPHYPSTQENA